MNFNLQDRVILEWKIIDVVSDEWEEMVESKDDDT